MTSPSTAGAGYVVIGAVWFLIALTLGAAGYVERWRPPTPQAVLVGLTVLLLVAFAAISHFRRWLLALDLRWLVGLHVTRFVGFYFLLVYYRDGALPRAFAVPGGWGDIVVATLALILVATGKLEPRRRLVAAWNTLGLLDILFVVATATRLTLADPDSMNALLRLPLSLLPTFLVPLIIVGHVVVYWRLARRVA